jgi:hypothetical protein
MRLRRNSAHAAVMAGLLLALIPSSAAAFNFQSPVSNGCHEAITVAGLRLSGWPPEIAPEPPSRTHEILLEQLLFDVPEPADSFLTALLVGARWNDLHGARPSDLPALAEVHLHPEGQQEHCARAPEHDGRIGNAEALAACRAFILEQVEAALGGGDADTRASVEVRLPLKHQHAVVALSRFAFHMGRAAHTLQDSYSHTHRDGGTGRVVGVLNAIDLAVEPGYDPARDGLPHEDELDRCTGDDASKARASAAVAATAELLGAVADPAGGRAGRLARVEAALDRHLSMEDGGVEDGGEWGWELIDRELGRSVVSGPVFAGCGAASSAGPISGLLLAVALLLGATVRRRRYAALAALAASILLASMPGIALAGGPSGSGMSLRGALGASVHRSAAHAIAGVGWQLGERSAVGVAAELNPWISVDTLEVDPGTASIYASGEYRWVSQPTLQIASKAHLGVTASLFDLVGVEAWSTGPYGGLDLLSAAFRVREGLWLTVDPATTVLEVLRLSGVPVYHFQYRFTVGLRFDLGA